MPTSDQIKRINTDPDGLDFESLKKQGIENVQRLCGDVWTDYNAHDPGVTILEQLCYGLTDLVYRSGFETQDYLVGENGEIDYQRQALFNPKDIFPSSPVTNADYQKVLYDAIPAIDNIWFEPVLDDEDESRGLYAVFVKLNDHSSLADEAFPNQDDRLSVIFETMESLRKHSDKGSETLDQLGHYLDARHEALRRRNDRVKKRALIAKFDVLLTQAIEVLAQLDANLSCLDSIWEKLDLIWSILVDDASRLTETIQIRLDNALSQFNELMNQPTLFPQLVEMLPELNVPLTKHDDLFFMLRQCLPKMETSLLSLDDSLRTLDTALSDIYDSLCEPVDAPERVSEDQREDIVSRVKTFFADHRNLCEDIHSVEIIKTVPYFLVGEIEVKPTHDLAKVYAEIFFKCAKYISSGIRVERYETVLADEKNYEKIFSGPLTGRGYINDHFLGTVREFLSVVDLIAVINQIDGVKQVRNLSLMDQENKKHTAINCKPSEGLLPNLCFPQVGKPMQVLRLSFSGSVRATKRRKQSIHGKAAKNKDKLLLEATELELEKLIFEHHAFRNNPPSFDQFIKLPKGQRRPLQDYTSIQNQFPAIYGINRYGVPPTASVAVKAKAKQLKAYLYPYEQLMANYLKNLQEMPRLFSQDAELKQSYFSQLLNNQNVPDIEKLYAGGTTQTQQLTAEIHSYYDNFGERRNRVLDTLLAMYGEEFPQQSLVRFNCYRQIDNDHWLIEKKTNYLQHICEMSRDRAQGFNYLASNENSFSLSNADHVASIQSKVSILLGLDKSRHSQWVTDALVKRKSRVVPEEKLATQVEFVTPDKKKPEPVPELHDGRTPHKDLLPVQLPSFSDAVFKEGIDLKSYQLVRSDTNTVVCFKPENDDRLWRITSKKKFDEAAEYARQFCHAMTQLNMESEGLHIVEHLLLRPYGDDVVSETQSETFYNFRVSVILPAWTARFSDEEFRRYAEETVQRNLPAHIYAEFFWLDFFHMRNFELHYKRWLKLLQQVNEGGDNTANLKKLNKASEKIISFLIKNKSFHECECWV